MKSIVRNLGNCWAKQTDMVVKNDSDHLTQEEDKEIVGNKHWASQGLDSVYSSEVKHKDNQLAKISNKSTSTVF